MKYLGLRTAAIPKLDSVRPEQIVQVVYMLIFWMRICCVVQSVYNSFSETSRLNIARVSGQ